MALEHATTRVPVASANETVAEVRGGLSGRRFDSADDVAVLEESRLVGVVPIERLLAASGETAIGGLMDADPPSVAPGTDQEHVAWRMIDRAESSMGVVDDDGTFRGLIPPYRMLEVLLTEHDEDMARIGGYLASTRRARTAAQERVLRRLWHRMPWLLIGLIGAMASAALVGAFEGQLDQKILLAFFLPAVVYLAAAVGTQTEAVLIRGLAVGVPIRSVAARELLTGLVLGVLLALAFLPFAAVGWGDDKVALAVSLSVFVCCTIAAAVAMALPWVLQRLGRDPAFGSGPLATVIEDLVTIAIYLAITTSIAL